MDSQPCHGFLGSSKWSLPRKVVHCDEEARPGYSSCKAHEYMEHDDVLEQKVILLARMIQACPSFIAYTGAGISTSSGIGDYASRSAGKQSSVAGMVNKAKTYSAEPTLAHRCLTALHFAGYLKWWCQQNHDGLPQKAGMPQSAMNEIHGSWWDPSNPVVPMSGNLREDLINELIDWEDKADLCLAVGTSLSGMNADRLVHSCGQRAQAKITSLREVAHSKNGGTNSQQFLAVGGSVIVGFQCTSLDAFASLRIYAPIDRVMEALAKHMQLDMRGYNAHRDAAIQRLLRDASPATLASTSTSTSSSTATATAATTAAAGVGGGMVGVKSGADARQEAEDVFFIRGYDATTGVHHAAAASSGAAATGRVVTGERSPGFWLDLREGSTLRIMSGCYAGSTGTVMGKSRDGNYDMLFQVPAETLTKRQQQRQQKQKQQKERGGGSREAGRLATFPWRTRLGKWMVVDMLEQSASHLVVMNA